MHQTSGSRRTTPSIVISVESVNRMDHRLARSNSLVSMNAAPEDADAAQSAPRDGRVNHRPAGHVKRLAALESDLPGLWTPGPKYSTLGRRVWGL